MPPSLGKSRSLRGVVSPSQSPQREREPFQLGPFKQKPVTPSSVHTPGRRLRANGENVPPENNNTAAYVRANTILAEAASPGQAKSASKCRNGSGGGVPPLPGSPALLPRPPSYKSPHTGSVRAKPDMQMQDFLEPVKRKLTLDVDGGGGGVETSIATPALENPGQDSGVKVILRMRPLNTKEVQEDAVRIIQTISTNAVALGDQQFTYDAVSGEDSSQQGVFDLVGLPMVENCLAGFNSSIFAYGQTGSGKTHTMMGATRDPNSDRPPSEDRGLIPRVFERLFARIQQEEKRSIDKLLRYQCRCSFLEIYNEQITDLLEPSQKNLQIREDTKTGVYVDSLTEEYVSNADDVARLLLRGLSNRRTGSTNMNNESSRSHSVFTCVIESRFKNLSDGLSSVRSSRMNLVDLAGSERQKQTGAAGERLKEAGNINRSLSQLGNVINILAEVAQSGKQRHVPYRDSRLTFLLQESLGGNAKLAMICAISPASSCRNETLSTLRFAQRAKSIQNKAVVNEETANDVNLLREQIRQLKDELLRMKSNGAQHAGSAGGSVSGWNARRSYNLLRLSLSHPLTLSGSLTDVDVDIDQEMEIDDDETQVDAPLIHHQQPAKGVTRLPVIEETDLCCDDVSMEIEDSECLPENPLDGSAVDSVEKDTWKDLELDDEKEVNHDLKNVVNKGNFSDELESDANQTEFNHGSTSEAAVEGIFKDFRYSIMEKEQYEHDAAREAVLCAAVLAAANCRHDEHEPSVLSPIMRSPPLSISPKLRQVLNVGSKLNSPPLSTSPRVVESRKRSLSFSTTIGTSRVNGLSIGPAVADTVAGWPEAIRDNEISVQPFPEAQSFALVRSSLRQSMTLSTPREILAASLHRGLQILDNPRSPMASLQKSTVGFPFPNFALDTKGIDKGVQTSLPLLVSASTSPLSAQNFSSQELLLVPEDNVFQRCEISSNECEKNLSFKTPVSSPKHTIQSEDRLHWQMVAVEQPKIPPPIPSPGKAEPAQLIQTVEALLTGAIRRERAAEELASKHAAEVEQLNRLVRQYKHERECNAIIQQSREDKIARLESLMDNVIPTDAFLNEEWSALLLEHKMLQDKFDNHPEVTHSGLEQQRLLEELQRYRTFFDLGEREVMQEEIEQLRKHLQTLQESSGTPRSIKHRRLSIAPRMAQSMIHFRPGEGGREDTYEHASSVALFPVPQRNVCTPSTQDLVLSEPLTSNDQWEEERTQWEEREKEWMSALEEMREEGESYKRQVEKRKQELDCERRCSEEIQEALQMAMTGHARLLEQYAELQEKHIVLISKQRKIREGVIDIKKLAKKAGVNSVESRWLDAQATHMTALRVEFEEERLIAKEEIDGLQSQLRDTAEAVQAAGELLVRLQEAEESVSIAQDAAAMAEQDADGLRRQLEKVRRRHGTELATLQQRLLESRLQKTAVCPMCVMAERVKFQFIKDDEETAQTRLEVEARAMAMKEEHEWIANNHKRTASDSISGIETNLDLDFDDYDAVFTGTNPFDADDDRDDGYGYTNPFDADEHST